MKNKKNKLKNQNLNKVNGGIENLTRVGAARDINIVNRTTDTTITYYNY